MVWYLVLAIILLALIFIVPSVALIAYFYWEPKNKPPRR
jgi:hypothetical protein